MNIADNIPNNIEHWLNISGYDNYQVSNFGRVRNSTTGKILKPSDGGRGYFTICLYKDKKKKTHKVHIIVANEFIDKIDGKNYVDHVDKNKLNNIVENLRWVSSSENSRNRSMMTNNTSNFKGVDYYKPNQKYRARIMYEGHRYNLGLFNTAEQAAMAYDTKAKELDSVYFTLNFN